MDAPAPVDGPVQTVELDDATLVGRARDGDVHAFEALVRRYQRPMFRLALRMLADRGDAEEVVQEVFVSAWRRLASLDDDAAWVGWLYRSTANACLNALRSRARRRTDPADPDTQAAVIGDPDRLRRPDHAAEHSAQIGALTEALATLPAQQRISWLLYEIHGRSYDEIAQTTGTSNAAVRGRIARARVQLAEVMAPWR